MLRATALYMGHKSTPKSLNVKDKDGKPTGQTKAMIEVEFSFFDPDEKRTFRLSRLFDPKDEPKVQDAGPATPCDIFIRVGSGSFGDDLYFEGAVPSSGKPVELGKPLTAVK